MPKRTTPQHGDEPAQPVEVTAEADTDVEAVAADGEPAEPVFENRAARRARGKDTSQPQPRGQQAQFARRGAVQNPRQYGNRRTG
jgi:hypothetical protein